MPSLLIENLDAFNRKERFHVVACALGLKQGQVVLSKSLLERIRLATGTHVPASGVFVAIDYHLDWLHAALMLTAQRKRVDDAIFPAFKGKRDQDQVSGKPEDIDLLIAFEEAGGVQLILIEAKADTAWKQHQIDSKARRLGKILGHGRQNSYSPGVTPYFLITSPKSPKDLKIQGLPEWARAESLPWRQQGKPFPWFELPLTMLDQNGGRKFATIVRCDDAGNPTAKASEAKFWKIEWA